MLNQITWLALYITAIIVGPVFSIWAVNTLFATAIPLNPWTWLSAAWIQIVLSSGGKKLNE